MSIEDKFIKKVQTNWESNNYIVTEDEKASDYYFYIKNVMESKYKRFEIEVDEPGLNIGFRTVYYLRPVVIDKKASYIVGMIPK